MLTSLSGSTFPTRVYCAGYRPRRAAVNARSECLRAATATLLIVAALIFALAATVPARADETDTKALMTQLQRIEAQVRALDAKVTALERAQKTGAPATDTTRPSPAVPAATGTPAPATTTSEVAAQAAAQLRREDAAVRQGWRQIKSGLTQDEVKELLGSPQQTFMLSGKLVWYYNYPAVGGGSVMLDTTGHVIGHQAPPFSAFGQY
jgi:hypothetical protein